MSLKSKVSKLFHIISKSATTRVGINWVIGEYGRIIQLKIDNKNKAMLASVLLKEESLPIEIRINK